MGDNVAVSVAGAVASLGADSVYMLLHPGWPTEARANRWHFARRWSLHLPVVIVSPDLTWAGRATKPEPRLKNCRILEVAANYGAFWQAPARIQIAQILDDMTLSGHKRPVLWLYNPNFAEAFSALPAVARVHHITENFFDYPAISPVYLERLKAAARLADLNVAVSKGCAAPLKPLVHPGRISVVTNGCDFAEYSVQGPADPQIAALGGGFRRIAAFAGNINDRLDFQLIEHAADACLDTLLLFVGKVASDPAVRGWFGRLSRRRNVKHIGAVNPDRLPAIYRAADFGFIPYTQDRLLVENGFPLKALEMAAVGLPVISTKMLPLEPLSPPLTVTHDDSEFLAAFSRAERTMEVSAALRAVAAANDYDGKFSTIVSQLASVERCRGWYAEFLPQSFAGMTHESLAAALRSYRSSLRGRIEGINYRAFGVARMIAELLPVSTLRTLRRVKWAVLGETRDI